MTKDQIKEILDGYSKGNTLTIKNDELDRRFRPVLLLAY